MIDFAQEDAALEAAVGMAPDAIVDALGDAAVRQLADVRRRYARFVEAAGPLSTEARLQRDRLDSLLQHLYGARGLLRRAGALIALRDRLYRIAALAPRCLAQDGTSDRLRREALLARTFAREQLARSGEGTVQALATNVARAAEALSRLDGFCGELARTAGDRALNWRSLALYSASDAADMGTEPFGVADGIAFVLRRLADAGYVRAAGGQLDAVCASHAVVLRDLLWDAAETGYAARSEAATMAELTDLDRVLEALRAKLTSREVDGTERAGAIAQLYALLASSVATDAALRAEGLLAPIRETLLVGLEAEATV